MIKDNIKKTNKSKNKIKNNKIRIKKKIKGGLKYDGPIDTVNHLYLDKDGMTKHKQELNFNKEIYNQNINNYGIEFDLTKEQNRVNRENLKRFKRVKFTNQIQYTNELIDLFIQNIRKGIKYLLETTKQAISKLFTVIFAYITPATIDATSRVVSTTIETVPKTGVSLLDQVRKLAVDIGNGLKNGFNSVSTVLMDNKFLIAKVAFLIISIIILIVCIVLFFIWLFGWMNNTFGFNLNLSDYNIPDINPYLNDNIFDFTKYYKLPIFNSYILGGNLLKSKLNFFKTDYNFNTNFIEEPIGSIRRILNVAPSYVYNSIVPTESINNALSSYNSIIGSVQSSLGNPTMIDKNNIEREYLKEGRSDNIFFIDVNNINDKKILTNNDIPHENVSLSIAKPKNIEWKLPNNNYKNADINKLPDSILNIIKGSDKISLNDKREIIIPWKTNENGNYSLSCDEAYFKKSVNKEKANILKDSEDNTKCIYNKSILLEKVDKKAVRNYNELDLSNYNYV